MKYTWALGLRGAVQLVRNTSSEPPGRQGGERKRKPSFPSASVVRRKLLFVGWDKIFLALDPKGLYLRGHEQERVMFWDRSILKVSSCLFAQYTQQQVSKYQMWPFIYSKASIKTHKKYSLFLPIKKKIQQFKEMFASKLKSYTETSCKQIILAGLYILINTCEYHW